MVTKYAFDSYEKPVGVSSKRKHHRRQPSASSEGGDDDPTDGNGSLTYSAASSINSAAGESTDSSLAGIMRVLDVQDSKELAAVLEKERARKSHHHHGDRSVTAESQHSLAYSTDAESHMRSLATEQSGLQGTGLLGTIAGQTSDQYSYDGGQNPADQHDDGFGAPSDTDDLIFAPAEHTDSLKRRKDKKRRERKDKAVESYVPSHTTPRVKNSKKSGSTPPSEDYSTSRSTGSRTPPSTRSSRPPKGTQENLEMQMQEEEDIWYAKWWMFCFPDTVKTMTPKR